MTNYTISYYLTEFGFAGTAYIEEDGGYYANFEGDTFSDMLAAFLDYSYDLDKEYTLTFERYDTFEEWLAGYKG